MQPATLKVSPQTQDTIDRFLPYLQEIQRKLFTCLVVFAVSAGLGFVYYQKILTIFMGLFNLEGITVVLTSPYQFIDLAINTAFLIGILVTSPLLTYYLLQFIRPALLKKEYKLLTSLLPISTLLFAGGLSLGIWVMNFVIDIFYKTSQSFDLGNLWDVSHFFSQTLVTAISLGIVFQFPIILTGLLRLRVIKRDLLTKSRRYIYAGCLLFAALLPPTDLLSLTLITAPLLILFELTLFLNQPHHLPARREVATSA